MQKLPIILFFVCLHSVILFYYYYFIVVQILNLQDKNIFYLLRYQLIFNFHWILLSVCILVVLVVNFFSLVDLIFFGLSRFQEINLVNYNYFKKIQKSKYKQILKLLFLIAAAAFLIYVQKRQRFISKGGEENKKFFLFSNSNIIKNAFFTILQQILILVIYQSWVNKISDYIKLFELKQGLKIKKQAENDQEKDIKQERFYQILEGDFQNEIEKHFQ